MEKQFEDYSPNLRSDLQRLHELVTCPCSHCLDICDSIDTVYTCQKYIEWFDITMEKREHDRQRRNHKKTP